MAENPPRRFTVASRNDLSRDLCRLCFPLGKSKCQPRDFASHRRQVDTRIGTRSAGIHTCVGCSFTRVLACRRRCDVLRPRVLLLRSKRVFWIRSGVSSESHAAALKTQRALGGVVWPRMDLFWHTHARYKSNDTFLLSVIQVLTALLFCYVFRDQVLPNPLINHTHNIDFWFN